MNLRRVQAEIKMSDILSPVEVEITALGGRGEGIAQFEGETLFVPYALPSEKWRLVKRGGVVEPIENLAPAADRIDPHCEYFGNCGGCNVQHLAQQPYLEWKRDLVVTALNKAGIETEVAACLDASGEGRRRATLHATKGGAGFNRAKSHDLCAIDACPILHEGLRDASKIATQIAKSIGPHDAAFTLCDAGIDLAIRAKSPHKADYASIAQRFDLARITLNGEIMIQRRSILLTIGTVQVALPQASFLQPTKAGEDILAELVFASIGKAKKVADLFCGVGPFALRLAQKYQTYAADSDGAAVAALDEVMQQTPGLKRIGVEQLDLFRRPLMPVDLKPFDCVVLDPPRAGAEAQIREIAKSKLKKLVYVSCDPTSFARDAKILIASGFELKKVTPVDQFVHSTHVELVGQFLRKK